MQELKPNFTREELLNKTVVDIRKNADHEFGYAITKNGLDITFIKDSVTHALFMAYPEVERNKMLDGALGNLFTDEKNLSRTVLKYSDAFLKKYEYNFLDSSLDILSIENKPAYESIIKFLKEADPNKEEDLYLAGQLIVSKMDNKQKGRAFFTVFHNELINQNKEITDFLTSTNLDSPFDEVVIKHYIADDVSASLEAEIYTYVKVMDRSRNLVHIERYEGGKDINWCMVAQGTYVIGHTVDEVKLAIRRSKKTTTIAPKYENVPEIDFYLPYDYLAYIYAWYKTLIERKTEVREITSKVSKASGKEKRKYIPNATSNNRRVIDLGKTIVVYTRDARAVKNIKKRNPVWHVDSFPRRGHDCHYHRKDGSILIYSRKSTTVHPKKNKETSENNVTYVVK